MTDTEKTKARIWDFDGVISLGVGPRDLHTDFHDNQADWEEVVKYGGPDVLDIVITGRCIEEAPYVLSKLSEAELSGLPCYFNPMTLQGRRAMGMDFEFAYSGAHKKNIITHLLANNFEIISYYEDEYKQARIVSQLEGLYGFDSTCIRLVECGIIHKWENLTHEEYLEVA